MPAGSSPTPSNARHRPAWDRTRHRAALAAGIALVHALALAWAWHHRSAEGPSRPRLIEVAVIATPPPPPPPPPPPEVRPRVRRVERIPESLPPPPKVDAPKPPVELALPVQPALGPIVPARTTSLALSLSPAPALAVAAPRADPAPPSAPLVPPRYDAAYLDNPAPAYPATARRRREQGRVVLRVHVAANGAAQRVEIATSSGVDALDQAALEAVRRWRFVPARRGDVPIAAHVHVPLVFTLSG